MNIIVDDISYPLDGFADHILVGEDIETLRDPTTLSSVAEGDILLNINNSLNHIVILLSVFIVVTAFREFRKMLFGYGG